MRLFGFERRWLAQVNGAILPSGASDALPLGAADVPMDRFVDDLFARAPLRMLVGVRLALWAVVVSPPFVVGRWATFGGLSDAERVACLVRLRESPTYAVREIPILLKAMACLGYCGLPAIAGRIAPPRRAAPPAWAAERDE